MVLGLSDGFYQYWRARQILNLNTSRAQGLTLDGNGEKLCRATRLAAGTRYSIPEVQGTCSLVLLGDHGAEKTRALLGNESVNFFIVE